MDQYKRLKRSAKGSSSIDGIISGGRQLGVPVHRSYQPHPSKAAPSLGSKDYRKDGFHVARASSSSLGQSPELAEASALLDEPITLDDIDQPEKDKKGHYFGHKHSRLRKIVKRSALALVALFVIGASYLGLKVYHTERHLFRGGGSAASLAQNVDINQLKGEGDGRVNILLVGIGGPGHDGPDLTDTIMVVSIDPVNHKAVLLSVPRDLWVKDPSGGTHKINATYAFAKENSKSKTLAAQEADGLNQLDKVLNTVLGIQINYHAVVDFQAFKDLVDNLGGVTVNVPEELYDPSIAWENNWNPVIAQPGLQTFNGQKALLYARSRETSSDFARSERQRLLMVAIKDKAFTAGTFSNPIKISNILDSLGNNVFTDLSLNDSSRLYQITSQIGAKQINSLDFVTQPNALVTTGSIGDQSVVEPKAGLFDYDDMKVFVRTNLPDGFLIKENAQVQIYNATNTGGLATSEAALLKTYGYNVTKVDSANDTGPAKTIVVDLSKGKDKYTRHYLEDRFGVTVRTSLPADSGITVPTNYSGFVIILGNDVANNPPS